MVKKPRRPNIEYELARLRAENERLKKEREEKDRRLQAEIELLKKEREEREEARIQKERDSIEKAEKMAEKIREDGFGPEDIAPTGEQYFEYLARISGITAREAYSTLMGSPPAVGMAA